MLTTMQKSHTNRWRTIWLLLALLLVPQSASAQTSSPEAASVARGEELAQRLCSRCHAIGKADSSPDPKAPPFREIGKNYPLDHLGEAFAEGIITGDNQMPQFKFGPRDVDAIIDYLAEMSAPR